MDNEPFTLVEEARPGPHHLFDNVVDLSAAKTADHDIQYLKVLREANPGVIVTCIPANNIPLLAFAEAGFATAELDTDTDSYASWRGYLAAQKRGGQGAIGEAVHFAKYHFKWSSEDFVLYTVGGVQYVLKECRGSENPLGPVCISNRRLPRETLVGLHCSCLVQNYRLLDQRCWGMVELGSGVHMGLRWLLATQQRPLEPSAKGSLEQRHSGRRNEACFDGSFGEVFRLEGGLRRLGRSMETWNHLLRTTRYVLCVFHIHDAGPRHPAKGAEQGTARQSPSKH